MKKYLTTIAVAALVVVASLFALSPAEAWWGGGPWGWGGGWGGPWGGWGGWGGPWGGWGGWGGGWGGGWPGWWW